MTNIAAAIGVAQMERIEFHLAKRRQVAKWYNEMLSHHQDLLQLPTEASWAQHSYWMYTVLTQPGVECDRDVWMKQLSENGVETRPIFYPIHTMPAYHGSQGDFPIAERCAARGVNLPTHGRLTRSDVEYVSEHVVSTLKSLYQRDRSRVRVA